MRSIKLLAMLLILFHFLDFASTMIAMSLGMNEANPIALKIIEIHPLIFLSLGVFGFALISYLVYLVARDHYILKKYAIFYMIILVFLKITPVVWNVTQIFIFRRLQ